jgi:hypothetical protein
MRVEEKRKKEVLTELQIVIEKVHKIYCDIATAPNIENRNRKQFCEKVAKLINWGLPIGVLRKINRG